MTRDTKQHRPKNKTELVQQYREVGIRAVAAAARYQTAGQGATRSHRTESKSRTEHGDAGMKSPRAKD